jgi:hypothetical protein
MDLRRAHVALRERPLLDILDLAVRFCTAHARAYAMLALAVLVPAFAASLVVASLGGWWLGWVFTVGLTAFAGAPFVALASRLVFEDDVRAGEAISLSLRAVPGLIGARFAQAIALIACSLLLGLPWLWVGTAMFFVGEVIVLERARPGAAIGRAAGIARAHFGAALMTMLLALVAPAGAAVLADFAGREVLQGLLEVKAPPPLLKEGGSWLALLGWWSALPLLSTARFLVYLDIRTRTEGWDIQTRFAAIAGSARS